MTVRAAVAGFPITHSLSPLIHGAWIAAAGLDASYGRHEVKPEDFAGFVERQRGGQDLVGVNVTLPNKQAALAMADRASDRARRAGAANVLLFAPDGSIEADNTDGVGLIHALKAAGFNDYSRPIAMIGAGGAAAGAIQALLDEGAIDIRLANRTLEKAQALAQGIPAVTALPLNQLATALDGAGLLINTTSAGTTGSALEVPFARLPSHAVVMDMEYAKGAGLLDAARAKGFAVATGLDMLIGQAIPSFEAFFGQAPDPAVDVRGQALKALGQ